ncbi:hypothetical protein GMOD_00003236 [Pyrenophora seminiperda CCB06]|uniref:Uncharacterized protein n=1 Tax=Pyrenophora seminiperda CCB06 TaxID=1302712 RepID=A0A3M7MIN7_9PLEO|nr:hypothetical protein GMOD_00003236 [Pyrenophora seminiperda CCB06]
MALSGFNWPSHIPRTSIVSDSEYGGYVYTNVVSVTGFFTSTVSSTSTATTSGTLTPSSIISTASATSQTSGSGYNNNTSSSSTGNSATGSVSSNSSSRLGGGAIAGIAIGGMLFLVAIIGVLFLWQRKRRVQGITSNSNEDEYIGRKDEKVAVGASPLTNVTNIIDKRFQEMSGTNQTHRLDPPQYHSYTIDPVHELDGSSLPGELPPTRTQDTSHTIKFVIQEPNLEITERPDGVESPHVEAQRRREVEWLEMEEARIRRQREILLQHSEVQRLG